MTRTRVPSSWPCIISRIYLIPQYAVAIHRSSGTIPAQITVPIDSINHNNSYCRYSYLPICTAVPNSCTENTSEKKIPQEAYLSVCCEWFVLSGRGLCDELITRLEESYWLWCVIICDLETSWAGSPWPTAGAGPSLQKQYFQEFLHHLAWRWHTWITTCPFHNQQTLLRWWVWFV